MPYHHGNLRAALLERAEQVLASDGADALALRSLARDVGVSHGAPGRHFPDRQALLDALAVDGFERLGDDLARAIATHGSFEQQLNHAALAYAHFATEHAALLELMYARKYREAATDVRAASDACAATLLELLTRADARIDEPERFGVILLATLQGIASLAATDALPPKINAEHLITDAVHRLLRGSSPPPEIETDQPDQHAGR